MCEKREGTRKEKNGREERAAPPWTSHLAAGAAEHYRPKG